MLITAAMLQTNVYAQFIPAGLTQTYVTSAYMRYTGNDIIDDGGDTYAVSVWDDVANSAAGISWEVNYSGNKYFSLAVLTSQTVLDPDVTLIRNQSTGDISALVFYFDYGTNTGFYIEQFMWDVINLQFSSVSVLQVIPGLNYGFALNIDANDNGEFAIVFDDLMTSDIYVGAGDLSGTGGTVALGFGNPIKIGSTGMAPDVAIHYDGNINTTVVYITYIESGGNLAVGWGKYLDLMLSVSFANISPFSTPITPPPSHSFLAPRIACGPANLPFDSWAVTYVEYTGSNYYIRGEISDGGTINSYTYNDNVTFPLMDISAVLNINPAICYDNNSDIWIGWSVDNVTLSGLGMPKIYSPIAIEIDKTGSTLLSGSDYLEVPTGSISTDFIDVLSLARRYATNSNLIYMTYIKTYSTINDLYSKLVPNNSTPLRQMQHVNNQDVNNGLNINTDEIYLIRIYGMDGKEVYSTTETGTTAGNVVRQQTLALPTGVYILKMINTSGTYSITQKLIVTER